MACASFYVGLVEDEGADPAASSSWNPTLCNPETFATVTGPVIGRDWEVLHSPVTETRSLLALSLASAGPSGNLCRNGAKLAKLNGTALYAFGPYLLPHSAVGSTPSPAPDPTTHVLPVNKELDLIGLRFCTQGFGVDFGPVSILAKNALVIQVGTSD